MGGVCLFFAPQKSVHLSLVLDCVLAVSLIYY